MDKILRHEIMLKSWKIRCVEEKLLELNHSGLLHGTTHTCIGQEVISAIFSQLVRDEDQVFSNHRCHGHFLATHDLTYELFCELLGRKDGLSQGIGGSQHLHHKNFLANGILGGSVPISVGAAWVLKKKSNGSSISFLGDGSLGEGAIYESWNFSALHSLPQLFIIENNFYSQSTHQSETMAGSIAARASAFGLNFLQSSIWDLDHLDRTMREAFSAAKSNKPTVLQVDCYRLAPHSKSDDHRSKKEKDHYATIDPVNLFLAESEQDIDLKSKLENIRAEVQLASDLALKCALSNSRSYLNTPDDLSQLELKIISGPSHSIVDQLNTSLRELLKQNKNALIVGEDLRDPYGGAFKVTRGLSDLHPEKVINFPVSEALIVGFSSGAAMLGEKVIAEIMFADFLSLTFDQFLNHASKVTNLSNGKINLPFILRTPTGGRRGYGATHSQSVEKFFAGIPGINVLLPHHRIDYSNLYQRLMSVITRPTIVFENKTLYSYRPQELPASWKISTGPRGMTVVSSGDVPDLTVLAFGGMGLECEEVMFQLEQEEIQVDLLLPLWVHEFELEEILRSLEKSKKIVIVEEGTEGLSLGAELLAQLHGRLPFSHRHVLSQRGIVPAAKHLEHSFLPSREDIISACLEIFDE